ncbi:protein kinase-like protein [Apiospora arundinis]|uniref:Protein kinase-like protein n=1 Tax=Apiospora arundinis TaxID=335852 RepID=A0ABR2J6T5_9PEZI
MLLLFEWTWAMSDTPCLAISGASEMENEHPAANLRSNRNSEEMGAGDSISPAKAPTTRPVPKTRSPTWSGPSSSSKGTIIRHGSESWDKPNYPIFGHAPVDLSAADYVNPHAKALDIQARVHAHQQHTPETWYWRDRHALQRATGEWQRDTDRRRVFRQEHEPCVACHASPSDVIDTVLEPRLGFSSSLTLQYNDLENYAWSLGHRYIMRERQDWTLHPARLPAEVEAERLLRRNRDRDSEQQPAQAPGGLVVPSPMPVPVPEVAAAWKEGQVAITITERARGRTLAEVWDKLTHKERGDYAREVCGYLARWRKLQSPAMQGIDGGPIIKCDHLPGGDDGLPMQFSTAAQYKERLRREMMTNKSDMRVHVEAALELMPDLEPFTLTHGYLDLDHIFVEDGRVTAIVGWSRAAYLPVWAEYLGLCFQNGPRQVEWKKLLMKNLPADCYYGKAPVALLMNYWDLRNHDAKAQSVDELRGTIRRCEQRCDDVIQEGRAKAKQARELEKRRASSAQRARLLEEERQRALEKGAEDLERARKEKEEKQKQQKKAAQDADPGTAGGNGGDEKAKKEEPREDTEQLTASNFFLNVEQERARARAKRNEMQKPRPLPLRPHDGAGGGDREGGGHRRTVSAFPSFSGRKRSPLRYKPQDKNIKARRPSELESPRIRELKKKLGFEPGD